MAKGVGTSKILGRVHAAQMKMGGMHITISINVLEDDSMEFLFGLDNLRRHQVYLHNHTVAVHFLFHPWVLQACAGPECLAPVDTSVSSSPSAESCNRPNQTRTLIVLSHGHPVSCLNSTSRFCVRAV